MISQDSKDDADELAYKILKIFDEYYTNCGEEEGLSQESKNITISVLCTLLTSYCVEAGLSINKLNSIIRNSFNMVKKIRDDNKIS